MKSSPELDDDTLLSFVEGLNGEGFDGFLFVKFPNQVLKRRGERKLAVGDFRVEIPYIHPGVRMTLSAFCARFRETNRSKWVGLFDKAWDDVPLDLQLSRPFLDLAAWDAMGREPPRHAYTTLTAGSDSVISSVMPQAIASIGMLAAVVGMGSSQIFQACYPNQGAVHMQV